MHSDKDLYKKKVNIKIIIIIIIITFEWNMDDDMLVLGWNVEIYYFIMYFSWMLKKKRDNFVIEWEKSKTTW